MYWLATNSSENTLDNSARAQKAKCQRLSSLPILPVSDMKREMLSFGISLVLWSKMRFRLCITVVRIKTPRKFALCILDIEVCILF